MAFGVGAPGVLCGGLAWFLTEFRKNGVSHVVLAFGWLLLWVIIHIHFCMDVAYGIPELRRGKDANF